MTRAESERARMLIVVSESQCRSRGLAGAMEEAEDAAEALRDPGHVRRAEAFLISICVSARSAL